ncbi:ADP-ribosylglycohydrolase family protein [Streptomyces roseoverticillatus]|uniref:ADP-ribosylglycohydrolase family protein n=1 Tax=Streptomyces roseoverticillatus TaxID=66429 RepID=A0ABV3J4I8_9ACTN
MQAALTHGHPTAPAAADLVAYAVHLLAHDARPGELIALLKDYAAANRSVYRERWLGDLWEFAQDHSAVAFTVGGNPRRRVHRRLHRECA